MKVLLTTHQFFPTPAGGTEVLARDTGLEMLRRGHEVHVLTVNRELQTEDPESVSYEDYEYQGLKVRALGLPAKPGAVKSVRREYDNELVASHVRGYVEELAPDVAHMFHAARLSASIVDVFKEAGLPVVFTATDFWSVCVRSTLMKPSGELSDGPDDISSNCLECRQVERILPRTQVLKKRLYGKKKFYRRTAEHALARRKDEHRSMAVVRQILARTEFLRERFNSVDAILAPSKVIYERLTANGIIPELVSMSPYGINVSRFRAEQPSWNETNGLRLGYVGQVHPQKGVHLLVEAFKTLSHDENVTLRVYGNLAQMPEYTEQLRELAGGDPRIDFVGALPSEEIAEEMKRKIDVLVVPSMWYENTPVVILEAFAAKTPVVATDLGGISQVVHHEENGLLFGLGDAQDLARQLQRLVEDPDSLRRYSENIGEVRSVEDNVDEVLELYERLLR